MPKRAPTHAELMRRRMGRKVLDAEYEAKRNADPKLALARRLRASPRWRKLRALKLARVPLCEDCSAHGVTTPATQVHHVEGVATRPDLAFVWSNLRSLCSTCHARIEAQVRAKDSDRRARG